MDDLVRAGLEDHIPICIEDDPADIEQDVAQAGEVDPAADPYKGGSACLEIFKDNEILGTRNRLAVLYIGQGATEGQMELGPDRIARLVEEGGYSDLALELFQDLEVTRRLGFLADCDRI